MATSKGGRPPGGNHQWAGTLIRAGGVGVALRAYALAGKGRAGLAAAYAALKDSFPEAHPRSIAAVIRIMREGCDAAYAQKRSKRGQWPASCPDARPLIRAAQRVNRQPG